jgi:hypothetical protein
VQPDTGNKYITRGGKHEHLIIAETALGRALPSGAEVHHVDGWRSNNRHSNLVICQDRSYHRLLHVRAEALRACGHVDWRKCKFCKSYSPVTALIMGRTRTNGYEPSPYHQACQTAYSRKQRADRGLRVQPWKAAWGNSNACRP